MKKCFVFLLLFLLLFPLQAVFANEASEANEAISYNSDGTHTNTTVGGPSLATTTTAARNQKGW